MAKSLNDNGKWMISAYTALLFLLIASPFMFKLVNSLTSMVGVKTCDSRGCPNMTGLVLHAVVFGVLVRFMMDIKLLGV